MQNTRTLHREYYQEITCQKSNYCWGVSGPEITTKTCLHPYDLMFKVDPKKKGKAPRLGILQLQTAVILSIR